MLDRPYDNLWDMYYDEFEDEEENDDLVPSRPGNGARYKREEEISGDEWDDYDRCYECRGYGDDYIINDDGELESWCDHCGLNPNKLDD